jgi:hypothetical protein
LSNHPSNDRLALRGIDKKIHLLVQFWQYRRLPVMMLCATSEVGGLKKSSFNIGTLHILRDEKKFGDALNKYFFQNFKYCSTASNQCCSPNEK